MLVGPQQALAPGAIDADIQAEFCRGYRQPMKHIAGGGTWRHEIKCGFFVDLPKLNRNMGEQRHCGVAGREYARMQIDRQAFCK
jgi:hypothetical protein